ncbi:aspartate aminotransferase-like [Babylonia areolata]|uniref:aspartate aminotransferase-like n=1 Tax=Babylonia areolata TaxID=304850 RepID=UPI003FD0E1F0
MSQPMEEKKEKEKDGGECLVREDLIANGYGGASNLMFNEQVKQWMKSGRKIYHFAFGQSPFSVIDEGVQALKKHAANNAYLEVQGLPELRQQICAFHAKYDDLSYDPSQVIVGPGSKELIYLLLNVFRGKVLVLSPSWTTYKPQAQLSGHTPVIVTVDVSSEWKLTPQVLEQAILSQRIEGPFVLILTNPCNPTGTAYSEKDLIALSAVFRKYGVIVLSDEIYARLSFDQNHFSLARVYPEGTILSTGLSKWASAGGWRVGYHVYPKQLSAVMGAVKSAASHTYSCAPAPVQFAAIQMFKSEDACEQYIRHTARVLATVADFCYRELNSVGVTMVKPRAGYYIFPDFEVLREPLRHRGIQTCEEMCTSMLAECSVAVMAGGPSYLRPVEELTTRLCYVNFDGDDALKQSRQLGLETSLPSDFVQTACTPVYDGIMALKTWVKNILNENQ